jgi:diguanylate cyclase (GGDEF)-like protein
VIFAFISRVGRRLKGVFAPLDLLNLLNLLNLSNLLIVSCLTHTPPGSSGKRPGMRKCADMLTVWTIIISAALLLLAGGLYYVWSREKALDVRISALREELEHKTMQLEEANQTLNRLAGIDSVTKLANHSGFQEFLRGEWRRALREASAISVIMADIDHFRDYNDRLGHQAGDECLAKVAQVLKSVIGRPGDLVARYGGEEFGIVLSRTDQQGAFRVAHKVCAAVEALGIEHPDASGSGRLTISVGVATATPAVDSNWEEIELVTAANRALAEAKQAGRNRVMAAAG